jgi:hypothetical protein
MHLIAWSYGELRASTRRSRPKRLLPTEKSSMDKKLFKRLTESMCQHSEIERRERAPSRVMTSRHDVLPAPAYIRPSPL